MAQNKSAILWLRKFGLRSARISRTIDELALLNISVIALADRFYFAADAVNEMKRKEIVALVQIVLNVILIGLFILLGFGLRVFLRLNPIAIPTNSTVVLIIATLVASLLVTGLFTLFRAATFALAHSFLEITHAAYENLRRVIVKLFLKPLSFDSFKNRIDNALARGKSAVVRVTDESWQDAVDYAIEHVDAIVIDLTDLSDYVMWEVTQSFKNRGQSFVRFVINDVMFDKPESVAKINELMSPLIDDQQVIVFPYNPSRLISDYEHRVGFIHFIMTGIPTKKVESFPLKVRTRTELDKASHSPEARARRRARRR